jgi:hypothetical protein
MRLSIRGILSTLPVIVSVSPPAIGSNTVTVVDTALGVGAGWTRFSWNSGTPAPANQAPLTFSHPTPVTVRVTDGYCTGDQFRLSEAGQLIGTQARPRRPAARSKPIGCMGRGSPRDIATVCSSWRRQPRCGCRGHRQPPRGRNSVDPGRPGGEETCNSGVERPEGPPGRENSTYPDRLSGPGA